MNCHATTNDKKAHLGCKVNLRARKRIASGGVWHLKNAIRCCQVVTKRCRLSWLTNSPLVYEPKCLGRGWLRCLSQWVQLCTWIPNKLRKSNSILNLSGGRMYNIIVHWRLCGRNAVSLSQRQRESEKGRGATWESTGSILPLVCWGEGEVL